MIFSDFLEFTSMGVLRWWLVRGVHVATSQVGGLVRGVTKLPAEVGG